MAVEIDLDIDASKATGKIGAVASSLKGLEVIADDLDIDFDADISNITDEIEDFTDALAGIEVGNLGFVDDLDGVADKLDDALDGEIDLNVAGGNDGGNDSDGTIPPDFDIQKFKRQVGEHYGFDPKNIKSLGLRDDADFSDLSWNQLQRKASKAGVYGKNPSRAELEKRLAAQKKFHGRDIIVKTDKLGTVSLERAIRAKKSETDIDATNDVPIPDKDSDRFSFRRGSISSEVIEETFDSFDAFGSKLRRLKPTMGKYMQLLAALIPIVAALGTQFLGVAAAMGSVAVAGGAIMGLGLLGHGESMADSFAQAKEQIRSLKEELFQVAQPTMQQFAPIQSRMFDAIPERLDGVFEEIEGLTVYEDTLFELGSALAGGMEESVDIIVENEQAISQLTTRFGGLIGSGLLDFFEWLIQAASENQQLIINLGSSLLSLAAIAYNLSMAISRIVSAFRPLFEIIATVTGFLNNKFIVGLLVAVTVFGTLILTTWKLTTALYAALTALASFGSGGIISSIAGGIAFLVGKLWGLITSLWSAVFASEALITTLSALTLGAFAVGSIAAGVWAADRMSRSGPSGGNGRVSGMSGGVGGSTTVYNDNRSYEINNHGGNDYASQKAMEDTVRRVGETEDAQSLPPVETSSGSSDTPPRNR